MAVKKASEAGDAGARLCEAQVGNGVSTDVVDRGKNRDACLLKIVTTVGATPTVTITVQGSMDNAAWRNVAYATNASPEVVTLADIVITTAVTSWFTLRPNHPWRYLRLVLAANTNVTVTADLIDA